LIGLQITNVKNFMNHLFVKETFDGFDLVEAVIMKEYTLTLEGKRNREQKEGEDVTRTEDQPSRESDYLSYGELRPFLLAHIRGKKTPQLIRMTLSLPAEKLAERTEDAFEPALSQIDRFLLNIRFDSQGLMLITGVSYRTFSMEKELEKVWDRYLRSFLLEQEIAFEE
jgi:hypothetical protein